MNVAPTESEMFQRSFIDLFQRTVYSSVMNWKELIKL